MSCGSETVKVYDPIEEKTIDIYEESYGKCGKDLNFIKSDWFMVCDYSKIASGCCYNYKTRCDIHYYVRDYCDTLKTILHELYHCCQDVISHGSWTNEVKQLAYSNCYD